MRRFQSDDAAGDSLILKSGRIPNDAYVKRLNEIFLNQRRALEPDSPVMTPSESAGTTDHLGEELSEKPSGSADEGEGKLAIGCGRNYSICFSVALRRFLLI